MGRGHLPFEVLDRKLPGHKTLLTEPLTLIRTFI